MTDSLTFFVLMQRARGAELSGNWDDAAIAYADAMNLANATAVVWPQLLRRTALVHCRRGEFIEAEGLLNRALQAAEEQGDPSASIMVCESLGTLVHMRGDFAQAAQWYQSALTGYQRLEDDLGAARTLNSLSLTYVALRQYQKADACLGLALSLGQHRGELSLISAIYANRARLYVLLDRHEEARTCFSGSLDTLGRLAESSNAASDIGLILMTTEHGTIASH